MDWLAAMNRAVDYLEDNIMQQIEIEKVAKIALSSPFYFQRMYHMLTGVTVAEYIRRRRLTLAAQDLLSGEKVITVAYKYGYETPEAFTKAFSKLHGLSPKAARKPGANLKAYPRLSFHLSIKGDKKLEYTIVEKEAFTVVGKHRWISLTNRKNLDEISEFWNECMQDGTYNWLCSKVGKLGFLGLCKEFDKARDGFYYMAAVENVQATLPSGFLTATVPAATWAMFETVGAVPDSVKNLAIRIYTEWFPAMGYQNEYEAELQVYPPGDLYSPNYRCQIWIPVKKTIILSDRLE